MPSTQVSYTPPPCLPFPFAFLARPQCIPQRHALVMPCCIYPQERHICRNRSQKKHRPVPLRDKREVSSGTDTGPVTRPPTTAAIVAEAYFLKPASTRAPLPTTAAALLTATCYR